MVIKANVPDIEIPNVDIYGLLFETKRPFPDDKSESLHIERNDLRGALILMIKICSHLPRC